MIYDYGLGVSIFLRLWRHLYSSGLHIWLCMHCDSCGFLISLHLGIRKRYRKCGWYSVFATNNKSKLKQSRSEENLVNSVVEKVKNKRRVCISLCPFKIISMQTFTFLCKLCYFCAFKVNLLVLRCMHVFNLFKRLFCLHRCMLGQYSSLTWMKIWVK